MNEKEMIEEMINYLRECSNNAWAKGFDYAEIDNNKLRKFLALFPEGSVVFQQKDLLKLQNVITQSWNSRLDVDAINYLTNTVESLKKQVKELEEQRDRQAYIAEELIQEKHRWTEQTRKETAKEILKWLKDHCAFAGWIFVETYFREQFGVEVEE